MMKTYSHIRRQALNQAADALEPNAPASPIPPASKVAAAAVPTPAKKVMSHSTSQNTNRRGRVVKFAKRIGSSGWIRTSNPPVNRLMQVVYPVGSSMVYLTLDRRCSLVFGTKLFTDCSLPIRSTAGVTRPIRIRRGRTICGPQGLSGAPACGATHRGWLEAWGLPRLTANVAKTTSWPNRVPL
jgi:hypothetical protein